MWFRTGSSILAIGVLLLCGAGPVRAQASGLDPDRLWDYAADTWRSVAAMERPSGLPTDHLIVGPDGGWEPAGYTSPTNIAAYLWSILGAEALGIIDPAEARDRVERTLAVLGRMERSRGFFFAWYDPESGTRLSNWPQGGAPIRPFLSCVDNGWLACALIMVGNSRPEWRGHAEALLGPMDFGFFYHPSDPDAPAPSAGLLRIGYWADTETFTGAHYGLLNTEPRIASYVGIARGQLPPDHYYRMQRTPRPERQFQQQVPAGEEHTYLGVPVFEGHYTYRGHRFVPSWGGSMFEALMVPLFVPEAEWAPESWGRNHPIYVRSQIEYARNELGSDLWGFSPASRPSGGYAEYGAPPMGVRPGGYPCGARGVGAGGAASATGCRPVVTPHASFLALPFAPEESLANLEALERQFPIYGPFGFLDSVDVGTGMVSQSVLMLDQGMILAAVANALADGVLQHLFTTGGVEEMIRPLIAEERFTAGAPTPPADLSTSEGAAVTGSIGLPAPPAGGEDGGEDKADQVR